MDRIPSPQNPSQHPAERAIAMDSSDEEWVVLDPDNPAESSDDDRGVLALPASTSPLSLSSDDDEDDDDDDGGGLESAGSEDEEEDPFEVDEDGDDDGLESAGSEDEEEDPFEVDEDEDASPARLTRPLSGMFHHTPLDSVAYAAFDPVRSAKQLIPDPAFSAFPERVSVLASARGLVCLRGCATGFYYVANPLTFRRVRLPYHNRDHRLDADPAVVIAFEDDDDDDDAGFRHYHVVVTYQVHDGVWAVESFSTRTWDWRVGDDICAPETVVAQSGVGARGRAFFRTTIGHILCYTPETGCVDLIPAPQEVEGRKDWEIGEMEGNFCVACVDKDAKEVAVLYMVPGDAADQVTWAWAGQFHANKMGYHDRMTLLRSQGAAEVVMWDPLEQLVLAADFDGRVTRSIGPLSGGMYYSDFIPYVNSYADIYSEEGVGSVFKTNDEAVTFKVPQASVKAEIDSN
ncbi:unnamed protein product [Triticum turgidum subsp. durum]|uniref:Uncharacterized protein n=1 Tax=Triticum turgidum subsp. durum TaxID=4567 RepID=A0A9R1AG09_TRITD|nr:unnamed protein product [Triticum turgidum subsp. durum]